MTRVFLQYLLPFLLPFIAYGVYLLLNQHAREMTRWPLFTLTVAGLLLSGGSLVFWALTDGNEPGQVYIPPSFEDGEMVPGRFVPQDQATDEG